MKTERRHELGTNTLATELAVWGEKLRPYQSTILIAVAALLGLYAAVSFWNARGASQEASAWNDYQLALFQGDIDYRGVRRLADNEDLAGTRMQEWAYVAWADRQLLLAAQSYLVNRDAAKEQLAEIAAIYELYAQQAEDSEVRNRARFGLARVSEMQNRFDDARENYAKVEGALAAVAAARLQELEKNGKEISAVATWLATAELPKPAPPAGTGLPGVRPEFEASPPAADAGTDPFDPARTLEEILGGTGTGAGLGEPVGGRYSEGAAATPAEETPAPGGDGAAATDEPSAAPAGAAEPTTSGESPAQQ
jgi:hypothetical protein